MIKMKKKLHNELFSHNEIFLRNGAKKENPFQNFQAILDENEVPFLSKRVARAKSSYFQRNSQKSIDFTTIKIHNHHEEPINLQNNYIRNSIFFDKNLKMDSFDRKTRSAPPKNKLIQPNLNAYLAFVDKKWKEIKKNKKNEVSGEKKENLTEFFSERNAHKITQNSQKTQKHKVEKDISCLHLNYRQIVKKLMENKKKEEFKDFAPHSHFLEHSFQKKKKPLSVHRLRVRNQEFLDDSARKDEMLETALSVRKIKNDSGVINSARI